ncbi:MAG: NAD(P)-dependent alcohol dehydrogenase, partial [Novosphingobium sp. 35-62-5]
MRQWLISAGSTSLDDLKLVEAAEPQVGLGEVAVRVRACSLNFRDQIIPLGFYMGGVVQQDTVPLSDGAGEVVAVGEGVTSVAVGDRVAGTFFQDWMDGPPNPAMGVALGAPPAPGMLQDVVVLPERGVVK